MWHTMLPNARPALRRAGVRNNRLNERTYMHIVINHQVNDPMKWDRSVKNIMTLIEQNLLPAGFKPVQYLPFGMRS